ncbi:helix-turn-helix transcriptional regulator [Paraglaciecola sp.]|uniref:helix-turn-helix transcriptional regulator n=1 Tax=Paraglaciecola sp. TaxID=1920173 RepID=UPI003266AFF1
MFFGQVRYKVLILLLLMHSVTQLFNILEELDITRSVILVTPAMHLALGPLYYLFVKNSLCGDFLIRNHFFHFMPTIVALAFTQWWPAVLAVAFFILIVYLFAAIILLRQYEHSMAELTSTDERYSFRWLQRTFVVICVIEFIDFVRLNLQLVLSYEIAISWYFVSACISLLITSYILIKTVRQPELYANLSDFHEIKRKKKELEEQVSQAEDAKAIFDQIDRHVTENASYLRPKFSLRDLASELALSEQFVSWSLNRGGELSFSDYINSRRLDALVLIMHRQQNDFNILQSAFDVGFSSKSTFNAVFKRHKGVTPSEFLKTIHSSGYTKQ